MVFDRRPMLDLLAAISSVDPPSFVAWAVLAFAASMYPVGIMLGASCSPCCAPSCYYGLNQGACPAWGSKSLRISVEGATTQVISMLQWLHPEWCQLPLNATGSSAGNPGIFPWIYPAGSSVEGVGNAPGMGQATGRREDIVYEGCRYCVVVGPTLGAMLFPCQKAAGSVASMDAWIRIRFSAVTTFTYDGYTPGTQPDQCYPMRRPAPAVLMEYAILDGVGGSEAYREHWIERVQAFSYDCNPWLHTGDLVFSWPPWGSTGYTLGPCQVGRCCASEYRTDFGPPGYYAELS